MHAPDVLRIALREADLLAHSGAPMDQVAPIIRLANRALEEGDGDVPDDEVWAVGMQDGELKRFGLG